VVTFDVINAARAPVSAALVRTVLRRASRVPEVAARLPSGPSTVAVRLTDDEELRRLHRDYSGEDTTTDVLSFAGAGDQLGDLAISWPAVVRQAADHGHPELTELALLCVHGFLHLLGWDHATAAGRREMARVTVAALDLAGMELAPGRL
jgi:probable rRNA maturation factor